MDEGPFDDYSDDLLKSMSRLELEQYASHCRDNYKRVVSRQNENSGMVHKYAIRYEINVFNK